MCPLLNLLEAITATIVTENMSSGQMKALVRYKESLGKDVDQTLKFRFVTGPSVFRTIV